VVRPALSAVPDLPDVCDCPACTGAELNPQDLIDGLVSDAAELLSADDPLDVELFGAAFISAGELAGEGFAEALAGGIVPAVAQFASQESLVVLLALAALEDGPASATAAERLVQAGVPAPSWAAELSEPVRIGQCRRLAYSDGDASILGCSFDRAGRTHGFVIHIDHIDCDAAVDIALFPAEVLDEVFESIEVDARRVGLTTHTEVLDPAEFRWQVERSIDARAVHDQEESDGPELADELDEDDGPGYHLLAALLRARMRSLPEPSRPPAPHGDQTAGLAGAEARMGLASPARQLRTDPRRSRNARPNPPPSSPKD
jgi:hypothetical protein